jgi:hypothetical protein
MGDKLRYRPKQNGADRKVKRGNMRRENFVTYPPKSVPSLLEAGDSQRKYG